MDYLDAYRPSLLMRQLQARYAFLGLLGRGGAGIVFEVENLTLKRREALKLFTQSFARDGSLRFAQEARIMAALEHPRIMPIYSFGEDQGCAWFAMKLVEGPTLARYLKHLKRLELDETLRVALPLLEALAFTHERGIIHRDIKPANVLLDPKGGPILTDFGIAKAESDAMRTETGAFLGTPAYISPEQGLGRTVDGRTDLYALGMVLFEMLAGRLPFDEGNSLAVVLQRFQTEAPSLAAYRPDLPQALVQAVDRSLAREVDQRFAHAEAFREALLQVATAEGIDLRGPLKVPKELGPTREPVPGEWIPSSEPATAETASPLPRPEPTPLPAPPTRRPAWPLWLAGTALVTILGTIGWASFPWSKPQPAPAQQPPAPTTHPAAVSPAPMPAKLEPRPARDTAAPVEPLRRAMAPPQLLERPLVDKSADNACAGQSASVMVQVDEAGAVSQAKVLSSLSPTCKEAALKAARACRFQPALAADGKPVASTLAISIEL